MKLDRYNKPITPVIDIILHNKKEDMVIVEVGVWQGETSVYYIPIAQQFTKNIYLVDWFRGNPEERTHAPIGDDPHKYDEAQHDTRKGVLIENLREIGATATILDEDSVEAAQRFSHKSIDFCFIDANHSYGGVKRDINAYLPRMKPGGIIAGHDYDKSGQPEVVQAVNEIFGENNIIILRDHNNPQLVWSYKVE